MWGGVGGGGGGGVGSGWYRNRAHTWRLDTNKGKQLTEKKRNRYFLTDHHFHVLWGRYQVVESIFDILW